MLTNVEVAQRNLEIIKLRNLAAWQRDDYAASHIRQADHPIYPGQAAICLSKAAQAERMADENEAKANLLEAQLAATIQS